MQRVSILEKLELSSQKRSTKREIPEFGAVKHNTRRTTIDSRLWGPDKAELKVWIIKEKNLYGRSANCHWDSGRLYCWDWIQNE